MGKKIMVDVLIAGSAVTGAVMMWQFAVRPGALMLTLALINLSTATFMAAVVRPLMRGKLGTAKVLANVSLVVLLSSWAASFWVQYFEFGRQPSSAAGALTWSVGALVCVADLVVETLKRPPLAEKKS